MGLGWRFGIGSATEATGVVEIGQRDHESLGCQEQG
jgi:hypothetical protein